MSPTKKSERKREELLDQGLALMWERGFNGVSVRDIVQAAGVPKGSFYFYFDSKDDFALEVLKRYVKSSGKQTQVEEDPNMKSPLARLRKLYEARAKAVGGDSCRKGCMMVNVANELGASNDELREYIHMTWTQMQEPTKALVQEAIATGEIDAKFDAGQLASFLENSWMGVVTSAKASQDPSELMQTIDFIFDQVLG